MKTFGISSLALLLSALLRLQAATASNCACFSASDTMGSYFTFSNGAVRYQGPELTVTWSVRLTNGNSYRAERIEGNGRVQYYCLRISNGSATGYYIDKASFETCRDHIQFTESLSDGQLERFEQRMESATVTLQNHESGRYLTLDDDKQTGTQAFSSPPTESQWTFRREECPGASADLNRPCFSLVSFSDDSKCLATNGVAAFADSYPTHILGYYTLEPTLCVRDLSSCVIRLQVAFYGDRSVSDQGKDPFLPLARGSDQEEDNAEWLVALV